MEALQNVLDTIMSVFEMIKDFFAGLFAGIKGDDSSDANA